MVKTGGSMLAELEKPFTGCRSRRIEMNRMDCTLRPIRLYSRFLCSVHCGTPRAFLFPSNSIRTDSTYRCCAKREAIRQPAALPQMVKSDGKEIGCVRFSSMKGGFLCNLISVVALLSNRNDADTCRRRRIHCLRLRRSRSS